MESKNSRSLHDSADDVGSLNIATSYSAVAEEYARRMFDELKGKALDRLLLDRFASEIRQLTPSGQRAVVCDIGCGPGHVSQYLKDRGLDGVVGVDISPGMVACARRLCPDIEFVEADLRNLPYQPGSLTGIVAFYSLIHTPGGDLLHTLRYLKSLMRPNGVLLLAFHVGDKTVHFHSLWDTAVNLDFHYFSPEAVKHDLEHSGWVVKDVIQRYPYSGIEHASHRAYLFATAN